MGKKRGTPHATLMTAHAFPFASASSHYQRPLKVLPGFSVSELECFRTFPSLAKQTFDAGALSCRLLIVCFQGRCVPSPRMESLTFASYLLSPGEEASEHAAASALHCWPPRRGHYRAADSHKRWGLCTGNRTPVLWSHKRVVLRV